MLWKIFLHHSFCLWPKESRDSVCGLSGYFYCLITPPQGSFQRDSFRSARHLVFCLPVGYVSKLLCLVHPPLHSVNPEMRKVVAMSSTSLTLTICYLKICEHTIPTRRKDICSNVFLTFLEVFLKKKKKNVHHFYQAYMRVNFLVVSMVSALKG